MATSTGYEQVQGAAASGASKVGNPVQMGGVFNTTQPTVTTGQAVEAQCSSRGAQIVVAGTEAFNVTVNAALPTGTNAIGTVTAVGGAASGASTAGNPVRGGANFNTTQPTVTNGQTVDLQATARGGLIVATGTDTFNVTVNAAIPTGSNTIGAVTQASGPWTQNLTQVGGAAVALGQAAMASSIPVAIASNQGTLNVQLQTGANVVGTVNLGASATPTGLSRFYSNAFTNTVLAVKVTAGKLHYVNIYNPNNTIVYVQIFNLINANVTLGTTTPDHSYAIPPMGWWDTGFGDTGEGYGTAISMFATTTSQGSTAPTTALVANGLYI